MPSDYWKCSKCTGTNDLDRDKCWNCKSWRQEVDKEFLSKLRLRKK